VRLRHACSLRRHARRDSAAIVQVSRKENYFDSRLASIVGIWTKPLARRTLLRVRGRQFVWMMQRLDYR
jgi:hypothetical protein